MAEEARQVEPVRMWDQDGDMRNFAPVLRNVNAIDPDEVHLEPLTPNAPGYDAEHRVWASEDAKRAYLDSLVHPADADDEHPPSPDPPESIVVVEEVVLAPENDLPKAQQPKTPAQS